MITVETKEIKIPAKQSIYELQITREDLQQITHFVVERSEGKITEAEAENFITQNIAKCGYVSLDSILKLYFSNCITLQRLVKKLRENNITLN